MQQHKLVPYIGNRWPPEHLESSDMPNRCSHLWTRSNTGTPPLSFADIAHMSGCAAKTCFRIYFQERELLIWVTNLIPRLWCVCVCVVRACLVYFSRTRSVFAAIREHFWGGRLSFLFRRQEDTEFTDVDVFLVRSTCVWRHQGDCRDQIHPPQIKKKT